jgi:hypothetical protein
VDPETEKIVDAEKRAATPEMCLEVSCCLFVVCLFCLLFVVCLLFDVVCCLQVLRKITDDNVRLMGLNPQWCRPDWMIVQGK